MIERFGIDGMSTDESSCDEDGGKRYKIRIKSWRSTAANAWIRGLLPGTHTMSGSGRPGRYRFLFHIESQRPPPKGLPRAAYNRAWLSGASEYTKGALQIDEENTFFALEANDR